MALSMTGPKTLSKQQFGQTPVGRKPGANYQNYLRYVATKRGQRAAAPVDPFAPTPQPQINAYIQQAIGALPRPQTNAQITTAAQGQIDPIVQAITKGINDRASQAAAAIQGLTDTYATRTAAIPQQTADIYGNAQAQQQAADTSLAGELRSGGDDIAKALSGRLEAIDSPAAVQSVTDPVLANAAGAAGASAGIGNASLSRLIGDSAAEQAFGAKLPGFARQTGLQAIGQNQLQATGDINDATTQLEQQLPSIVQALTGSRDQQAQNAASLRSNLLQFFLGNNTTKATAKAGLVSDQQATTAKTAADTAAARTDAAKQATTDRLNYAKTYGVDPVTGTPTLAARKAAAAAKTAAAKAKATAAKATAAKGPKPPTAGQLSKMVDDFYSGKKTTKRVPVLDSDRQPVTNANGVPQYVTQAGAPAGQLTYQQAYKRLRTLGVDEKQASGLLETKYKRGERGRPWLDVLQRKALAKAKVPAKAQYYKTGGVTLAYLLPAQVTALRAAGMLPPGKTVEGHYVIDEGY